jgi:hypothetical protein
MGLVEVNDRQSFEHYTKKYPVNVVMITGQHCPACRVIEPEFRQKSQQNPNINYMIVNSMYFQPFQIESLPSFAKYYNGNMVDYFKATGDWTYNRARLEQISN